MTVGTELLLGDTIDTNAAHAGLVLAARGIRVARRATVGDRAEDIRDAVDQALARTGLVLVTGGLGPTRDDITRDVVATLLGCPLQFDEAVWDALVARWAAVGRTISESNRSQAMVPAGATVLPNRRGSAPGLWIETARGLVILLPGVPIELQTLLAEQVLPRLEERLGLRSIRSRVLRTSGIPESRLGELLGPLEESLAPVTLAYLPDQTGVDLRLTAWELEGSAADAALDQAETIVREAAGEWVYATGLRDLAEVVLAGLRERGMTLVTAESCTGGLVGARVTAIAGSSDVYLGGIVSYANEVKITQLGVHASLIVAHGAVSEPVVAAMARGAAERLGARVAIAVSGVAGPGGGTPVKPVGTVCFGWSIDGSVTTATAGFAGDREQVRIRSAQAALLGLHRRLTGR
ncbi:MAG: competence/damage-inducible protein A [Gemmatimonadales bacterium]|nr:competence/damage-inducible protein A [Gemmatimonadales bacterium]